MTESSGELIEDNEEVTKSDGELTKDHWDLTKFNREMNKWSVEKSQGMGTLTEDKEEMIFGN